MKKNILKRLEAIEEVKRAWYAARRHQVSCVITQVTTFLFAYYLGGLQESDVAWSSGDCLWERSLRNAFARALNYTDHNEYFSALLKCWRPHFKGKQPDPKDLADIEERHYQALTRLFEQVGLDVDRSPFSLLSKALDDLLNRMPAEWLNMLERNLRQDCPDLGIGEGPGLSVGCALSQFFGFPRDRKVDD
jgi:hypothetical protein